MKQVLFVKPPMRAGTFYFRIDQYINFFKNNNYQVAVFYPAPDGSTLLERLPVKTLFSKALFSLKYFKKFLLDLIKSDLVIMFPSPTAVIYALIVKLMRKKLVIEHIVSYLSHKDVFPNYPFFCDRLTYSWADAVITHTETMKEELGKCYQLPNRKLFTLYCNIDLSEFTPRYEKEVEELKKALKISNKKIVLYHGLHHSWHGLDILLEAAKILEQKRPDIIFVLLPGFELKEIEWKGNVIHLSEKGHYSWKTLPTYLQMCDVWASGFRTVDRGERSFSSTLIQALAMGRPIITSPSKEKEKILIDNENVLYVAPNSSLAIAQKIIEVLDDNELREKIGRNARRVAEKHFSIEELEMTLKFICTKI